MRRSGGLVKQIKLTKGKFAIVDDDWFEMLDFVSWYHRKNGNSQYAENIHWDAKKVEQMHRVIMDPCKDLIDHIDGNGLNNCRNNLRHCNKSQNGMNAHSRRGGTSKYKGVCLHKKSGRWRSTIVKNQKQYSLGMYDNEEDAARAYNKAALEMFGEFANINDIKE